GILVGYLNEVVDPPDDLAPPSNFGTKKWRSKKYHSFNLVRDQLDAISFCGFIAAIDYLGENEATQAMAYHNDRAISL
ncbi:MAG: hypothetical protein Q9214_007045, partial [Letrouitia sp. 1 TL-2023]